jgi:hypothetical protein
MITAVSLTLTISSDYADGEIESVLYHCTKDVADAVTLFSDVVCHSDPCMLSSLTCIRLLVGSLPASHLLTSRVVVAYWTPYYVQAPAISSLRAAVPADPTLGKQVKRPARSLPNRAADLNSSLL